MSFFVKATPATQPKTKDVITMSRLYAILIGLLLVGQLGTFTNFLVLFEGFGFTGGHPFAHFLATLIVIIELFALPFLLRVRMSPLARAISMVCGWLIPVLWLFISIWLLSTINAVTNIGFLGTLVDLVPGWWCVLISIAFALLAGWASWGMWPDIKGKKKA